MTSNLECPSIEVVEVSPFEAYSRHYEKKLNLIRVCSKDCSGWTVNDGQGILSLRPYQTEKELIKFIESVDDWRVI